MPAQPATPRGVWLRTGKKTPGKNISDAACVPWLSVYFEILVGFLTSFPGWWISWLPGRGFAGDAATWRSDDRLIDFRYIDLNSTLNKALRKMLALVTLQATPWLPTWLTPLWILGAGIAAGFVISIVFLGVLALLSFVPGLGTLADNPRRALVSSVLLGAGVAGVVFWQFLPQTDSRHWGLMVIPVCVFGLIMGSTIVFGMWRRTVAEIVTIFTEGPIAYVLGSLGIFVVLLGLLEILLVAGLAPQQLADHRSAILDSVPKYNWLDDGESETVLVASALDVDSDAEVAPFEQFFVEYDPRSVDSIEIESNRTIIIGDAEKPEDFLRAPVRIDPDDPLRWQRGDFGVPPLTGNADDGIWIQNQEIDDAEIVVRIISKPPVREVSGLIITALTVCVLIFTYLAFRQGTPKIAAIALATAKSEMAQPIYLVLIALGSVAMLVFMILPFHTLGEDIKLMKDSGMVLIMVFGLFQAVWSAGTSVADEIEGRTALTVLSKPVSRRSFLIGKYAGIVLTVLVLFVILGLVLMTLTAYKPIFEARENSAPQGATWQACTTEMFSLTPALVLYFMETMVIAAIGVALATRLAMLANFVVCFTIYVVGNLTAPIVRSPSGDNELVGFIGKLIAVVIPNLNAFNVQAAVDVGNEIPAIYLAGTFNYLICFGIMALMIALLLFEDRDLA